jgi:hypothetical protein
MKYNYTSTSTFKEDLKFSQQGENELKEVLESYNYYVTTTQDLGKFSGYDLTATCMSMYELTKIEFKHDRMCDTTGNVAIELSKIDGNGEIQLSGLYITEADEIFYKLGSTDNFFYGVSTTSLKAWVNKNSVKYKTIYGGDGGRTLMMLVPIHDFKAICEKLRLKP